MIYQTSGKDRGFAPRKIRELILDQNGQRWFTTSGEASDSLVGGISLRMLEVGALVSDKLTEDLPNYFPYLHTINIDELIYAGISALVTVLRTLEHLPQLRCVSRQASVFAKPRSGRTLSRFARHLREAPRTIGCRASSRNATLAVWD